MENDVYAIGIETVVFKGELNKDGLLCTRITHGNESYLAEVSPKKLIDHSLKKSGSSLRGALDSSKYLLGNINMSPIVLDAYLGIYLFPSKSPDKADCTWFNILHVVNYQAAGRYQTEVFLNYGHTIIVDMKESNFKRKLKRAHEMRRILSKDKNIPITFYIEPNFQRFTIRTKK